MQRRLERVFGFLRVQGGAGKTQSCEQQAEFGNYSWLEPGWLHSEYQTKVACQ